MISIPEAIDALVPGAQYGGYPRDEKAYGRLRWTDDRPKPPWNAVAAEMQKPLPPPRPPLPNDVSTPALLARLRLLGLDV